MSLESYVLKSGLISYSYKFRYRGRWYRGHIGPKSLRQAKLDEMQARILAAEGKHPLPKRQQRAAVIAPPIPTFREFGQRFIDSYAVDARPRSVEATVHRMNAHLMVYFQGLRLDQATTGVIDVYRTIRRQEGAAPRTINGELATLSLMLHKAAEWGIIPKASVGTVRWLRVEETPVRVLTGDEEKRLLIAATAHLRPLITFALHTGLRKLELLTLTWDDIDLARKEVTVTAHRAKNRHRRVVPLNQDAIAALQEAHTRHGRVFGYRSVGAPMDRAAKQAGLPGVNNHVFRKTFATRMIERGADLDTVRELLGHRSLAVTQRYVRTSPAHARHAVDLLGGQGQHRRHGPF